MKKGQLQTMPILDTSTLNADACRELLREVGTEGFDKFPMQFEEASQGRGARKLIDDFLIDQLEMSVDLIPYYRMLAEEPVVTSARL